MPCFLLRKYFFGFQLCFTKVMNVNLFHKFMLCKICFHALLVVKKNYSQLNVSEIISSNVIMYYYHADEFIVIERVELYVQSLSFFRFVCLSLYLSLFPSLAELRLGLSTCNVFALNKSNSIRVVFCIRIKKIEWSCCIHMIHNVKNNNI